MNALYYSLDKIEFSQVSTCTSAYEMWNTLEITHEDTSHVKETKINLLVHKYELFTIKLKESIVVAMYTRFTDITNSLQSLGKVYTQADQVRKILRSLTNDWEKRPQPSKKQMIYRQ